MSEAVRPSEGPLAGLRILVVEDETMLFFLAEDMLTELGCAAVLHASRVKDAAMDAGRQVQETVRDEFHQRAPAVTDSVREAAEHVKDELKDAATNVAQEAKDEVKRPSARKR